MENLSAQNNVTLFTHEQFGQLRIVTQNDEPWFVAVDVCRALEHSNVSMALNRLDADEKAKFNLGLSGGETNCVNEPGLYSLVLGSRKREAKDFKRWITHEVIPAIRKHGMYLAPNALDAMLNNPNAFAALANRYAEEYNARVAAEKKIEEQAPKVLFADCVASSRTDILVGELAKLLKQNGIQVGQNRLFELLRRDGYLISRKGTDYNMPSQRSMELGLMRIKETPIAHADGHTTVSKTPKITGKGQVYFVNKYAHALM